MPRFVHHFRSTVMVRLQLPTPPPSTLQERASDRALACSRGFARFSSCLQPFLVLVRNFQPAMLQGAEQEARRAQSKPQPVPVCKRSEYLVF
jgi:hypothetical protein